MSTITSGLHDGRYRDAVSALNSLLASLKELVERSAYQPSLDSEYFSGFFGTEFLDRMMKASTAVRDFREKSAFYFASDVMIPAISGMYMIDNKAPKLSYDYEVGVTCMCSQCTEKLSKLVDWFNGLKEKGDGTLPEELPRDFLEHLPVHFKKVTTVKKDLSIDDLVFYYGENLPIRDRSLEEDPEIMSTYAPNIPSGHMDSHRPSYAISYTVHRIRIKYYEELQIKWRTKNSIGQLEKMVDYVFGHKEEPVDFIGTRYVTNQRAELLVRTLQRANPFPESWKDDISLHRMRENYFREQLSRLEEPLRRYASQLPLVEEKKSMEIAEPKVTIVEIRRFPWGEEPVNVQLYTPRDEEMSARPKSKMGYQAYKTMNLWKRLEEWGRAEWDLLVHLAEGLPLTEPERATIRMVNNMAHSYR